MKATKERLKSHCKVNKGISCVDLLPVVQPVTNVHTVISAVGGPDRTKFGKQLLPDAFLMKSKNPRGRLHPPLLGPANSDKFFNN